MLYGKHKSTFEVLTLTQGQLDIYGVLQIQISKITEWHLILFILKRGNGRFYAKLTTISRLNHKHLGKRSRARLDTNWS